MDCCRKFLIVGLYLIDNALHTHLIFGWRLVQLKVTGNNFVIIFSSISLILKKEGFFASENTSNDITVDNVTESVACSDDQSTSADNKIGLIMILSTSLLGILLLLQGFLRDYISFGICRLLTYTSLCITYFLFAIAEPNHSDYLQVNKSRSDMLRISKIYQKYLWIFQFGFAVGFHQYELQFLNLYPSKIGFLIGISNALGGAGSFFPLAWKILIEKELISYSGIMWIWCGLAVISLILGTLIYPWHNLPQNLTKGTSLIQLKKIFLKFSKLITG